MTMACVFDKSGLGDQRDVSNLETMPEMHPKGVRNLLLQLLLAVIPAILTLSIESLSVGAENPAVALAQEVTMILLFPGMLISIAAAGNVHAWLLWVAAVANFLFYFVLIRLGARLYSKVRSGSH